jgi:5'-3' exonuclease
MIPGIEADDVIAHIVNMPQTKNIEKVIVSSDKDFIQLCNKETVLYRPVQKEVLTKNTIIDKFEIHPNNFALARAISGDKSDNLKGVGSVGLKTVAKRFPMLKEEKSYTIDEIVKHCKGVDSKLQAYRNIIEKQDLVRQNYKIMQLYAPLISIQDKDKIKATINDACQEFNKTGVLKLMMEDGFGAYDWTTLFTTFRRIIRGDK